MTAPLRVGVPAEGDDGAQALVERPSLRQRPQGDARREEDEALVGTVDRTLDTGDADEVLELLAALAIIDRRQSPAHGCDGSAPPTSEADR